MASKLTLSIDAEIIKRAKHFAKNSNRSLSEIIESYLTRITQSTETDISDDLKELIGIISLPENFDEKDEIRTIMTEKHLE